MPNIFLWNGYKFFFFSNEGIPLEFCHVHIKKGSNIAKFWIEPEIKLDYSYGFTSKELLNIKEKIAEKEFEIRSKWNEYFNI